MGRHLTQHGSDTLPSTLTPERGEGPRLPAPYHAKFGAVLWIAAGIGASVFCLNCFVVSETDSFGMWHDDTLLFSSAKALAEGKGYILPSWPGTLPQTKYPPLYPLLLSFVWQLNSSFPQNLTGAHLLTAVFGIAYLAGCWFWFATLRIPQRHAAWMTAVCAAHPALGLLSASLLSDMPFAALAIWCAIAADRALLSAGQTRARLWVGACVLAALAILTRTLGLALLLGLIFVAWRRRLNAREWAALTLPAAAFVAWTVYTSSTVTIDPETPRGYFQTVTFYSSYLRFWGVSVTDTEIFLAMVRNNLLLYLFEPAVMTLQIPLRTAAAAIGSAIFSLWILIAVIRRVVTGNASLLHFAWISYSAAVLLWNYSQMWRFLLVFLPLFLLALSEQAGRLIDASARALQSNSKPLRILGGVYIGLIAVVVACSGYGYLWRVPQERLQALQARQALLAQKQEAYTWIRQNTPENARFIAYEDVLVYLYTGRSSARPVALTHPFRTEELDAQVGLIEDVAAYTGADYWITSKDDFEYEPPEPAEALRSRTQQLFEERRPVFASADGSVRIYERRP